CAGVLAECVVVPVIERDADHRAGQHPGALHAVERPEGHFLRQVAADPEDRQDVGGFVDVPFRPFRHRGAQATACSAYAPGRPASSADQEGWRWSSESSASAAWGPTWP